MIWWVIPSTGGMFFIKRGKAIGGEQFSVFGDRYSAHQICKKLNEMEDTIKKLKRKVRNTKCHKTG